MSTSRSDPVFIEAMQVRTSSTDHVWYVDVGDGVLILKTVDDVISQALYPSEVTLDGVRSDCRRQNRYPECKSLTVGFWDTDEIAVRVRDPEHRADAINDLFLSIGTAITDIAF